MTLVKVMAPSAYGDGTDAEYYTSMDAAIAEWGNYPEVDIFEVDGILTYLGFRKSIPRTADGRISYRREERHIRKPYVLKKGETVSLTALARR